MSSSAATMLSAIAPASTGSGRSPERRSGFMPNAGWREVQVPDGLAALRAGELQAQLGEL